MAEQLQTIQRRIKSIESTEKIANAMQLVAAAKLKQSTNRFNYSRNHLGDLVELFKKEIDAAGLVNDPQFYSGPHQIAPSLTIVITGSKGMCGSYNSSIIKELDAVGAMTTFLPLGSKGFDHIRARDMALLYEPEERTTDGTKSFREFYEEAPDEHPYSEIMLLARDLDDKQRKGEIAEIHLIYASYKNSISYEIVNRNILPVYNISDIPEIEPILEEYLALTIYRAIAEAAINEYGARRLAMKNASDNAEEMLSELELSYHRARQAQITDELIEIISGTESQRALEEEKNK